MSLHTSIFPSAQQCTTGTQPSELADHFPLAYDPSAAEVQAVGCLTSQHKADKELARVVWSAYRRHLTLLPAMRLEAAGVCNAVLPSCRLHRQLCVWLTLIFRADQISLTTIGSYTESTFEVIHFNQRCDDCTAFLYFSAPRHSEGTRIEGQPRAVRERYYLDTTDHIHIGRAHEVDHEASAAKKD